MTTSWILPSTNDVAYGAVAVRRGAIVRVAAAGALLAGLPLLAAAPAQARPPFPLAPACETYTFSKSEINLIEDPVISRGVVVRTIGANVAGRGYYIDPGTDGRRNEGSFTGGIRGRTIDITAKWDSNGAISHYTGQVNDDGSVTGTMTGGAVGNDWQNDRWHSGMHWLACATVAAPMPRLPAPPPPPPVTDAITLNFAPPGLGSITATVTNSSDLPAKCTYDATGLTKTHRDFTVNAHDSTDLTFNGFNTGTSYYVVVSCHDASGKQTQEIGRADQDVTF